MFKISLAEGVKNIDKNKFMTYLTVFIFSMLFLLQGYTYSHFITEAELKDSMEALASSEYKVYRFSSRFPSVMVLRTEGFDQDRYGHIAEAFSEFCSALDEIENLSYNIVKDTDLQIVDFKGDFGVLKEDGSMAVGAYKCSPGFFQTESYRVIKGRNLTDEDIVYVEGEPRPVLLGYKFKDLYDVGDIIKVIPNSNPRNNTYYFDSLEVIGILAEDTTYVAYDGWTIFDMDNSVVFPALWIGYDEVSNYEKEVVKNAVNLEALYFNHIKLMVNSECETEVLADVQSALNDFLKLSKYYSIVDSKYAIEKMESRTSAVAEFSFTVTSVLMFFAFITVLISIVNRISRNLKDYSIHIALGASRINIVSFILCEMSIILFCSIILGTVATKWVTYFSYLDFDLFKFLNVYIATCFVVLLISAVTTLFALRKYDVCTLIK